MPRVLITDNLSAAGLRCLKEAGLEVDVRSGLKPLEVREALKEADGIIIRSGTTLTAELLKDQPRLKVIVRAGVGVDNIDIAAATREGIVVMNTPAGNTTSTAEHTIAMLLALSRNIAPAAASMKAGKWDRKSYTGTQLAGKTLGYAGSTIKLLGGAVSLLVASLTFVIAFYYFLADGPSLIDATEQLIPVHRDYIRSLLAQFDQAVRAVVTATFAAALAQGIATGIGMQIAGFPHFFIVTILSTLTALVPVLGTWLIWGPFVLWLGFHEGQWGMATFLTLYGAIFVGFLDNVIRAYVLHSNVKLHPLLAFVCVLGGIEVMGLWGVFIGPIVASCLHALIKIFNTELKAFSQDQTLRPALQLPAINADAKPQPDAGSPVPDAPTPTQVAIVAQAPVVKSAPAAPAAKPRP